MLEDLASLETTQKHHGCMMLSHVMNWPCMGLTASLLAVDAGTLVSQQGLEMCLAGLGGGFIFEKGEKVPKVPPSALRVLGGDLGHVSPDAMAPGAHGPGLQAETPPPTF